MAERTGAKPDLTRLGRAIETARERLTPHVSMREVARRAGGVSVQRYRQVIAGVKTGRKPGERWEFRPEADTVLPFALAVHMSPEELETAGRPDVALLLRDALVRRALASATSAVDDQPEIEPATIDQSVTPEQLAARLAPLIDHVDRATVIGALAIKGYRVVVRAAPGTRRLSGV